MKISTTVWIKRSRAARSAAIVSLAGLIGTALPGIVAHADAPITNDNARLLAETDGGDLIADAVRSALGADIGFVPAAAFKPGATAPRPVNGDQAAALVDPASDTLSMLTLRGDQIIAALERSVSFEPQPSSGFLQVSGLRYTYDLRKEGGKRVLSVTVNGQPLDASKTYKVATTKPLAHGQQGYFQIWDKSDIANDSSKTLDLAIKDFVKSKGGSASPATDGRISETEKR
jgi:2',3'-cyclic-nucleotide 2'-phosphodiesterase (5'-nucleotidase family)